ncbi:hypothetical protein HBI71_004950 [Parastagonospora nodorum]|nr:hypothetical protein HBI71_004950 [Parastagonospora nodorum]KAH5414323.1 hypothetical protein HBI47_153250 [Parastagonospora nodorum]
MPARGTNTAQKKITYGGRDKNRHGRRQSAGTTGIEDDQDDAHHMRLPSQTQTTYTPSSPVHDADEFRRPRIKPTEITDIRSREVSVRTIVLPISAEFIAEAQAKARRPRIDYSEELKHGLTALAIAAYGEELGDRHSVAKKHGEELFRVTSVGILASIPRELLELLVGGNLSQALHTPGHSLVSLYNPKSTWKTHGGHKNTPCIYVRQFVDSNGLAPTPNQYLQVIARLRAYVSGKRDSYNDAVDLDNRRGAKITVLRDIQAGRYQLLNGSVTRVVQILTFCYALEDRIKNLPAAARNQPFPKPHNYVGYTIYATKRMQDHETTETSWFHHMVSDAFRLQIKEHTFEFHAHLVCFLCKDESAVAEALIGVITDSMIETGGGFGIVQGGVQTTSSLLGHMSPEERDTIWKACQDWREEHTPYESNLKAEEDLLKSNPTASQGSDEDRPHYEARRRANELEEEVKQLNSELENVNAKGIEEELQKTLETMERVEQEDPDSDDDLSSHIQDIVKVLRRRARARADIA